jgi:hypothetical protein
VYLLLVKQCYYWSYLTEKEKENAHIQYSIQNIHINMDNVQNCDSYINRPSRQTYR